MCIRDRYKEDYKVILIDFLGHGRSDRLEQFPTDFWYDQAMQVIELLTSCRYGRVNLIGTSGGALAALNVALERPDLVCSVIADSFEGEKSLEAWTTNIAHAREETKKKKFVRQLWDCLLYTSVAKAAYDRGIDVNRLSQLPIWYLS